MSKYFIVVLGILANRFRIFLSPILLSPENVEIHPLACYTVHNFLCDKSPLRCTPLGHFDAENLEKRELQHGNKRGKNSAIILIHRTEQYRSKTDLYKLSCIQFKMH